MTISTTTASQTSTDALDIDLGGSELKVIYNPNISAELKSLITSKVAASMESVSGSSNQYEPCEIKELIESNKAAADTLSETDLKVVAALNSHYDYIEF